jgi:iron complex outermembrane receptor protein/hemoglobin/transferrin/lactoferrin receptor protein
MPIDRSWAPLSASAGLEWWTNEWLTLMVNADQGFRAPNLDDLTSRQQTGPGFQFENADLKPEKSLTLEVGGIANTGPLRIDLWAYRMSMEDAMARAPRNTMECPPSTPACSSSWSRFQLVNLDGTSVIYGAEGGVSAELPADFEARATLSYAWGEGPSTEEASMDRVPLSRIPPLNGTAEIAWRFTPKAYLSAATRWATLQDRLALQDESDARIPAGGTPGFVVFDLRAGYRATDRTLISATFENIGDVAYRYHGSSVNGPGRSLSVFMQIGL